LPLRNFVTDASRRADSSDRAEQECALRMMLDWAKNGAMETPPTDFGGPRELERFGISLNIIALKLRADGLNIDPLVGWLGDLNRMVTARFRTRGRVDNLYVWSGVAAASYALLSGDGAARRYANDVWLDGVAAIRPDGFVDSELRRGSRALLYHVYNLSALLTLRAFRNAMGDSISDSDQASLMRLIDRVGDSLCDPASIAAASGSATQEKTPAMEFAPIVAFAGNSGGPHFLGCAPADVPKSDPILGGQFDRTVAILANSRNPAHGR
jgi:poly(beta-D-mannuronate) lyase